MKVHGIVLGILMGCVCLLFGLVPGLLQDIVEEFRNFRDSLAGLPMSSRRSTGYENLERPVWPVVVGAMLIGLSLFAYLSN